MVLERDAGELHSAKKRFNMAAIPFPDKPASHIVLATYTRRPGGQRACQNLPLLTPQWTVTRGEGREAPGWMDEERERKKELSWQWFSTGPRKWFPTGPGKWFPTGLGKWFPTGLGQWFSTGPGKWFPTGLGQWFSTGLGKWFSTVYLISRTTPSKSLLALHIHTPSHENPLAYALGLSCLSQSPTTTLLTNTIPPLGSSSRQAN
ncbi:hypothetical protein EYF80_027939 [Liparis tanakae]|uniref:Uncharacterized protein n=1 Tax=Liparis tanakae TaxID=230148 RepID=A0A4Z2HAK9_9TELE|nr:hypothetical protein EYF80_027939 [Liparis tanakae]